MKVLGFIAVVVTGVMLLVAAGDFPAWGDPSSPASTNVSPYYIQHSIEAADTPNVVTAVLADFRGFDTMFETTVIFAAGVAVFFILRMAKRPVASFKPELTPELIHPRDIIIQTVVRLVVPFIQLYALYVIAHGHHSPGGGFQGGVILGSGFILLAISFDLKAALQRISERRDILLANLGVLIYAGIGMLCVVLGGNFLDYSALGEVVPVSGPALARSRGILGVEIGVAIGVMAIMTAIYANLSSRGRLDKGL